MKPAPAHLNSELSPQVTQDEESGKKKKKSLPSWKVRRLKDSGVGAFLQQLQTDTENAGSNFISADKVNEDDANSASTLLPQSLWQNHTKESITDNNEKANGNDKIAASDAVTAAPCRGQKRKLPAEVAESPELRKYWHQRYRLFSRYDRGVRLDREGWFSATPERIAKHIAERCRCDVIVDAFCGVGGNAIQFASTCRLVIAVDVCPERLEMARHNARVYGVQHRIQFVLGDFFQLAPRLRADAVFLSPPWGGPQYSGTAVYDMYRLDGSMDGRDMMRSARLISDNVAVLAPRNASQDQLASFAGRSGRVEVEQNLLNGRAKTITAYYGGLIRAPGE